MRTNKIDINSAENNPTSIKSKQLTFNILHKLPTCFGGSLLKNSNAKIKRTLDSNKCLHIVLRSSLAKGSRSMLNQNNKGKVYKIIQTQAKKVGIKIYRYANVGNHLHLLIKFSKRRFYIRFIRSITGLIARQILKAEKNNAASNIKKFWDQRPFSRIVDWGTSYRIAKDYVTLNILESLGVISRAESVSLKEYEMLV